MSHLIYYGEPLLPLPPSISRYLCHFGSSIWYLFFVIQQIAGFQLCDPLPSSTQVGEVPIYLTKAGSLSFLAMAFFEAGLCGCGAVLAPSVALGDNSSMLVCQAGTACVTVARCRVRDNCQLCMVSNHLLRELGVNGIGT